mmetsp:Transcript_39806/g.60134  ORF Transcript_39806/g.60134 Transcript_39806/m.60134 type:complete len:89 (+) Transcript_39806:3-269(+)
MCVYVCVFALVHAETKQHVSRLPKLEWASFLHLQSSLQPRSYRCLATFVAVSFLKVVKTSKHVRNSAKNSLFLAHSTPSYTISYEMII